MKTDLSAIAAMAVGGATLLPSAAHAAPVTYNFTQSGFSGGGSVTGSFTADDLDSNGQISTFAGEVSDFSLSFSGDSIVSDFSFSIVDLFGLVYDLGAPELGDGITLDTEGLGAESLGFSFVVGAGPFVPCDSFSICGLAIQFATGGDLMSSTTEAIIVEVSGDPVPLPGAALLFAGGVLVAGRMVRKTASAT